MVTRVAGTVLPSQKKFTGVCTVATEGFEEEMLIGMPSSMENALLPGTVANRSKLNCSCCPTVLRVTFGVSQAMSAPTSIVNGAGEAYPEAEAVSGKLPTVSPKTEVVPLVAPRGMTMVDGTQLIFLLSKPRVTVVPPNGAG